MLKVSVRQQRMMRTNDWKSRRAILSEHFAAIDRECRIDAGVLSLRLRKGRQDWMLPKYVDPSSFAARRDCLHWRASHCSVSDPVRSTATLSMKACLLTSILQSCLPSHLLPPLHRGISCRIMNEGIVLQNPPFKKNLQL